MVSQDLRELFVVCLRGHLLRMRRGCSPVIRRYFPIVSCHAFSVDFFEIYLKMQGEETIMAGRDLIPDPLVFLPWQGDGM